MADKKVHNYMENVLQLINKNSVSLESAEVKHNNEILKEVLNQLIQKMQERDILFKKMFSTFFYGGSFFDGLRVGHAEEFDLDLLLKLPAYAKPTITIGNIPGFVNVQLLDYDKWIKQPEAATYGNTFSTFLDKNNYLMTEEILKWFQGVVIKGLNHFEKNNQYCMIIQSKTYNIKTSSSGPAITLKLSGYGVNIDIDFVPCFIFDGTQWPKGSYRQNSVKEKSTFFIVPKKPKKTNGESFGRYWRLSFQEQERILMNNKRALKPALKLLKKLRDQQNHACIASYFIKTIFLLEVETTNDPNFWNYPLSYVFMFMLEKYRDYIKSGKIPYYWNKKLNLIDSVNPSTLYNIQNQLTKIINNIQRYKDINDPNIIATYLDNSINIKMQALNI